MILIVDFGSQTTHLISRRLRELGVKSKIVNPEEALFSLENQDYSGIILSGGPSSVYSADAPKVDISIFTKGIPILGICYGMQLTSYLLGGKVISGKKEFGPAELQLKVKNSQSRILRGLENKFIVWMSHGDEIMSIPFGFETLGSTDHVSYAFVEDSSRKIFGVQFHPEVEHTDFGNIILKNFIDICDLDLMTHEVNVKGLINDIKNRAGNSFVIGAISGGVDSTVAGFLTASAIGEKFIPIYVDNGLMRFDTKEHLEKIFSKLGIEPIICEVKEEMLKKLKGVNDPEEKRRIIGNFYIEIFEREMERLVSQGKDVKFLLQGTIYSDVIESQGSKHSSKIKSHHNVGGLPENMKLKLIEPLREFYKDEVKKIGRILGLPEEFINRQPFPGPGYAIRIRGDVTEDRLEKEKLADKIVIEELHEAKILSHIFLSFPVLSGAFSTAVKGDEKFFGEVIALRVVESQDIMTSKWARIPYEVLQRISSRIVNEVPGVSRVVYDISTKPPATMEWE